MGILNYTTQVQAAKTVAEISQLLARKGAESVSQRFGAGGKVVAIEFSMRVGGVEVWFRLPANEDGVFEHLKRSAEARYCSREQAYRVSWRILKDWCEAQIALIESGQGELGQVFMPYALASDGRTMYELFVENNQKQLGAGGK